MLLCLAIIVPTIAIITVLALCMLRTGSKGECAICGTRLASTELDYCPNCCLGI